VSVQYIWYDHHFSRHADLGSNNGFTGHLPGGEPRTTVIMDRYRAKTSTFFSKLANGLRAKQRPLSESLGPPGPQTSLGTGSHISLVDQTSISSRPTFAVFELPNELILSVLSYVSPDPGPTSHYERFRFSFYMHPKNYHAERVEFLLPLSMTCRAMRLRLLPWIWERIEGSSRKGFKRRPEPIVGALRADPGLAMNVKYFRPPICLWTGAYLRPLKVPDDVSRVG
jgi:hypothetical protein